MVLVGLVGRRGAGKDTIADHLVASYGFVNLKFAAPLKAALMPLFGLTHEHVEGRLKDEVHPAWGVTPRAMMQFFGTDVLQGQGMQQLVPGIGRDFAVRRMFVDGQVQGDVVISDVRFPHEVDAIRSRGGFVLRVRRNWTRANAATDEHVSESGVDALFSHAELDNDGDVAELLAKVDRVRLWV